MESKKFIVFDVSSWQTPKLFDWAALKGTHEALSEHGGGVAIIARATYGAHKLDKHFQEFAERIRAAGLIFGAYHFYRQVHSAEDQLAAWQKQIDAIGGFRPGDLFPTLDMEENSTYGDGFPKRKIWNRACDEIGDAWKAEHGGCILYYSSYFPDYLGAAQKQDDWKWMHEDGYYYWLADYGGRKDAPQYWTPNGKPRTPYQPQKDGESVVHLHQPWPRPSAFYAQGKYEIDHDYVIAGVDLRDLCIKAKTPPKPIDDDKPPGRLPEESCELLEDVFTETSKALSAAAEAHSKAAERLRGVK